MRTRTTITTLLTAALLALPLATTASAAPQRAAAATVHERPADADVTRHPFRVRPAGSVVLAKDDGLLTLTRLRSAPDWQPRAARQEDQRTIEVRWRRVDGCGVVVWRATSTGEGVIRTQTRRVRTPATCRSKAADTRR